MMKHTLNDGPVEYGTRESGFTVEMYLKGLTAAPGISGKTRYFYSLSPLELKIDGSEPVFIPERCALKVHPNHEVSMDMAINGEVLMVTLHQDEGQYFHSLARDHAEFIDSLEGNDEKEWIWMVGLSGVDNSIYNRIFPNERNSDRISRPDWGVIAPAHSRRNDMAPDGWHLMYARGSVAMGVGTDYLFRLRTEEAPHKHGITVETYISLGGKMDFEINGELVRLEHYGVLINEPGTVHAMKKIVDPPYAGVTLQFPSMPGDKYTPEGIRIR